jgi:hypothetical protein
VAHLGADVSGLKFHEGTALSSVCMNVAARERFEECDEARMAVMSSPFMGMKHLAPPATETRAPQARFTGP